MVPRVSVVGRLMDRGVALLLRSWHATTRIHVDVADPALDPRSGAEGKIYCFWHEHLLFFGHLVAHSGIHVLISKSRDGERIARVVEQLGFHSIRGSTMRGGASAALAALHLPPNANLGITSDGPRGPRRQVKAGAVFLSSRTQRPIVPLAVGYSRAWRARRSWDQMALARPFSRIVVSAGEPIQVPADADEGTLADYRLRVETAMHELTERAESMVAQWAAKGERPTCEAGDVATGARWAA